jgi:hypothetical protein
MLTPEEHWAHFEKAWKALKSYTYLGKTTPVIDKGVERETMPLRGDMRNGTGGITAPGRSAFLPLNRIGSTTSACLHR